MSELAISKLDKLAREINEAHSLCNQAFKYTLNHAISAGERLIEAKSMCGHGNWLKWHEKNINHTDKTSETYMGIAKHKEYILANSKKFSNLSIQQVRKLLPDYKGILSSERSDWWTPQKYIDAVYEVMDKIDLDPASCEEANIVVRADNIYTESDDGLIQPWYGKVFLNPPYGREGPDFVEKLYNEFGSTVSEAILLVNSRATDSDWFQSCFEGVICFTDHRIDFDSPYEKPTGSTHGSCFVYFGPNKEKFAKIFSQFGNVVRRWPDG